MFKRSLASLAVVAVASGAVVAPANAITVTVNKDMCTIEQNDEEAKLTKLKKTLTSSQAQAALTKASVVEPQLPVLRAEIEKDKEKLANLGLGATEEEREKLRRDLEKKEKKFTVYQNLRDALDACTNGRNYDPSKPGPNNPERPSKPGPNNPERPSKPGPNNPERERALPSTNGAVIGVIVAVLGILVAALPVIKSMLPAQLRALLP